MWRVLWLLLLGSPGCALIPSRMTDCSATRPCPEGQFCHPDTSTCEEYGTPEPDLMLPECTEGCQPCQLHADCPSLVCDVYRATLQGGTCVAARDVVYVDNQNGTCATGGDGETPATAACTLEEGLARIDGIRKTTIRIMPSTRPYGAVAITDTIVSIYGPAGQGGRAQLGSGPAADAVTISGRARVILDGLDISRGKVGVLCSSDGEAHLALRRSRVTFCADIGILVSDCGLLADAVLVQGNQNGALALGGAQPYSITNSIVARNRSSALPAIKIGGTGPGTFRFNTVADNWSMLAAGIDCGGVGLSIGESIVVRNQRIANSQFQGGCRLKNTVVGALDWAPGIKVNPEFARVEDIDYGLDPRDRACCIDKARICTPTDYFGSRRPRGLACDIGAHER
jgi:hypothetical protein